MARNIAETTVEELKQQFIKHPDAKGFVVDGFPRDIGQAFLFEEQVGSPDVVVFLACSSQQMRQRLKERARERGLLDDNPHGVEHRLETFKQNAQLIGKYYQEKGTLVRFDADREEDEIFAAIRSCIQQRLKPERKRILGEKVSAYLKGQKECSHPIPSQKKIGGGGGGGTLFDTAQFLQPVPTLSKGRGEKGAGEVTTIDAVQTWFLALAFKLLFFLSPGRIRNPLPVFIRPEAETDWVGVPGGRRFGDSGQGSVTDFDGLQAINLPVKQTGMERKYGLEPRGRRNELLVNKIPGLLLSIGVAEIRSSICADLRPLEKKQAMNVHLKDLENLKHPCSLLISSFTTQNHPVLRPSIPNQILFRCPCVLSLTTAPCSEVPPAQRHGARLLAGREDGSAGITSGHHHETEEVDTSEPLGMAAGQ
ncbi:hypothetical protein L345_12626, partial [Ophiophagus hannah]